MRVPRIAVLCLLLSLPARGSEDPEPSPWGDRVAGLRCRAAISARIEEDLPLTATIEFECAPEGLEEGVTRFRTAIAGAFLTLELVHVETGTTLEVLPHDPTGGLPFSFEGKPEMVALLDGTPIARVTTSFPLATAVVTSQMTTAGLDPGKYEGRIRFTYPGPRERWPAPRAEREAEGFWRGTVVTGPFPLVVEKPPPRTRKLLVPRRLRLDGNREVVFSKEDVEEIEIPARNGHLVLAELSRDGWPYRTVEMPAPGAVLDGWRRHRGAFEATYRLRILQTPWGPGQWRTGPRRGGSTFTEWKRDFILRGPFEDEAVPPEEPALPNGAVLRLGSRRFRHPGGIGTVACSPDGRLTASACYRTPESCIRIWETGSGRLVREIPGAGRTLEFSPDGRWLATDQFPDSASIHDVGTGERFSTVSMVPPPEGAMGWSSGPGGISCVRFSPDGKRLALGGHVVRTFVGLDGLLDGEEPETVVRQLSLVDVETGREVRHFAHERGVTDAAFSPDGKLLASVDGEKVRLFETDTGKLRIAVSHWSDPRGVRFSADGTQLLVDTAEGLGVLDPRTGKEIYFRGGLGGGVPVAVKADGTLVAAGGWQTIRLWDPRTWEPVGEFRAAQRQVSSVAFAGDLIVSADGNVIRVWDPEWGNQVVRGGGHEAPVDSLLFSPDGETIASASPDATVRFWDSTTGEVRAVSRDHHSTVHALALSPDGRTFATADYLGVRLWDVATGEDRGRIRAPLNGRSLAFSPDGETLAIVGERGSVVFWDITAGRVRRRVELPEGHCGSGGSVAYSPDGSILARGPRGAVAFLYDPAGNRPGRVLLAGRWPLARSHLAFSPDGTSLLCVGREALVLDLASGEIRHVLPHDATDSHSGVGAWSPDGRTIATAIGNGNVRLWSAGTGRPSGILEGHDGRVTSLAFSPDGRQLASGGADTTILVREVPVR